jgi:uncharacterized membrane protein
VAISTARVAQGCAAITWLSMVATPLIAPGKRQRNSTLVVGALSATTLATTATRWGWTRSLGALASTAAATCTLEAVAVRTGVPFGRYHYTDELRPQVAKVPVIVPLAWFAMGVPAREIGAGSALLGGAALTAWDAFLDPQMTSENYWRWDQPGRYRNIPASNYAGWMVSATAMMKLFDAWLPRRSRVHGGLVAIYVAMAAMETVGFAAFFKDRLVALVGGSAMGAAIAGHVLRTRRLPRGGRRG